VVALPHLSFRNQIELGSSAAIFAHLCWTIGKPRAAFKESDKKLADAFTGIVFSTQILSSLIRSGHCIYFQTASTLKNHQWKQLTSYLLVSPILDLAISLAFIKGLRRFDRSDIGINTILRNTSVITQTLTYLTLRAMIVGIGCLTHRDIRPSIQAVDSISAESYALTLGTDLMTLIHELGHAALVLLLRKNPNLRISVAVFDDSGCFYDDNGLTPLGERLGPERSKLYCTLAGPLAELSFSICAMALDIIAQNRWPRLGVFLLRNGETSCYQLTYHALIAFSTMNSQTHNDFIKIAKETHISLKTMALAIGALPLFIKQLTMHRSAL
jgi:hypothetical protein